MELIQGLSRAAQINGDGVATIDAGQRRSWAETAHRVASIAGGLTKLGIGKGDRIALLALNSHRYFELLYAVPSLGAIIVPLNIRLAVPEIAFALEDSGARMLILDENFAAMPNQLPSLFAVEHLVYIGNAPAPAGMRSFEALLDQPVA